MLKTTSTSSTATTTIRSELLTSAECELLNQRGYAVVLGLVQQLLDVHAVEGERSSAQVVEDDPEEVGVAVDEDGAVLVPETAHPARQEGGEEGLLLVLMVSVSCAVSAPGRPRVEQRLTRSGESRPTHVQMEDAGGGRRGGGEVDKGSGRRRVIRRGHGGQGWNVALSDILQRLY